MNSEADFDPTRKIQNKAFKSKKRARKIKRPEDDQTAENETALANNSAEPAVTNTPHPSGPQFLWPALNAAEVQELMTQFQHGWAPGSQLLYKMHYLHNQVIQLPLLKPHEQDRLASFQRWDHAAQGRNFPGLPVPVQIRILHTQILRLPLLTSEQYALFHEHQGVPPQNWQTLEPVIQQYLRMNTTTMPHLYHLLSQSHGPRTQQHTAQQPMTHVQADQDQHDGTRTDQDWGIICCANILACPCLLFGCSFDCIKQYERGVIMEFGNVLKPIKQPGVVLVNPISQELKKIDIRTKVFDMAKQRVITKDNVTIMVDALVYYKVRKNQVRDYIVKVKNPVEQMQRLTQTILQDKIKQMTFQELLANYDDMREDLKERVDQETDVWGIEVDYVEIKEIFINQADRRDFATAAITEQERKGKIILAQAEKESAEKTQRAAEKLNENKIAVKLRYLSTVIDQKNYPSKIYFPIPINMNDGDKPN